MASREDVRTFFSLPIDFSSIGLEPRSDWEPYFCTPEGAEPVGWIGCDGVHFVLLPGDEQVYCVDPAMGQEGTYVLPVGRHFREFLSFVLFCRDANPISQISWMTEEQYRNLLKEDAQATWPGCEETFQYKAAALSAIADAFGLEPRDPFEPVKAMQAAFDPSALVFSDEYYDVLGLENPRHRVEREPGSGCGVFPPVFFGRKRRNDSDDPEEHPAGSGRPGQSGV